MTLRQLIATIALLGWMGPACACMSIAYTPGPTTELAYTTLDGVLRQPIEIRMSAGGSAVLRLPLPDARGTWSVLPVNIEAVAVYDTVEGQGKSRVSRHEFDYRRLNPYEVTALENGDTAALERTRWRNASEIAIPLRMIYRVGKRSLHEIDATLHVERGVEYILPRPPQDPALPIPKC